MTEREELESALANAEAAREQLEAALATAKAALVNTVTDASKIDANRADTAAKVEKARARCRQLRAALIDSGHSDFITRSRERIDTLVEQSAKVSKPNATATLPAIQSSEQAVRVENKISQDERSQRKPINRTDVATTAQKPRPKHERVDPYLIRHAIGFLALVLAYLAYFHVDVQFQIVSLPSIIFALPIP